MTLTKILKRHHFLRRNLEEATDYAEATLAILEYSPKVYPQIKANQYATLSAVARVLNHGEDAARHYREAFKINQEIYRTTGRIQSQLVASYTELARVLIMINELDEAGKLIKESVRLRQQMPNFSRLQLYSSIIFSSYIENIRGEYKTAEAHLLEALRDRESVYGKDDRESSR